MKKHEIRISNFHHPRGTILMLALVFVTLFSVTAIGIVSLVSAQRQLAVQRVNKNRALAIAESGLNYYSWHLAHAPTDYQDGTGAAGPYIHPFTDQTGHPIGSFSLNIIPPGVNCADTLSITSTGWTQESPNTKRILKAQYGRHSIARFSFLTDSNVWFGDTEIVHGSLHSNGGIRMDGSHDNVVTSAKSTYTCGTDQGCANETKPGVWGIGGIPSLWNFPVPTVDFSPVNTDLANLQTRAEQQGLSFGNLGQGYRIHFLPNGQFELYRVKQLKQKVWSYNLENWEHSTYDIENDELIQTYSIPVGCAIIFVEDNVWIDGVVNGRVTVVAAKLPDVPSTWKNIIINGNLTYGAQDGSSALGLIAQNSILVPLSGAPDNLTIHAVLLAQNGRVARYFYETDQAPYHLRNSITLYGAIMTKKTWTWSWVNGSNDVISGFVQTSITFDPHVEYSPPPGFPANGDYRLLKWEEITEKQ